MTVTSFRWRPALATTAVGALALTTLAGSPATAAEGPEQIANGDFSNGTAGWNIYPSGSVVDGWGCNTIAGGTGPYGAGIGQAVELIEGETYQLSFKAKSSVSPVPAAVRAVIQGTPSTTPAFPSYDQFLPEKSVSTTASDGSTTYSWTFTAPASITNAELWVFQQTGTASEAYTFCVDDVSLVGGAEKPVYKPDTGPRVRVNQVGYLPWTRKRATLVTEQTEPVAWQVRKGETTVASGMSKPRGVDASSEQNVHVIDFTSVRAIGTGYTLVADGETSFPFDISARAYEKLRVDSLSFFYPQRSGEPILGEVAGEAYDRPAGHVQSPADATAEMPNKGDLDVPCQSVANQTDASDKSYYPEGLWSCPEGYTLDVTGGWYDAGDHGKYVVNGGISVAQLLSTFERNKSANTADRWALRDRTLRVPERGNGVPDILDEARVELEWMLKMQVPSGTAPFTIGDRQLDVSGLAHHKIHDEAWTGLPLMPHLDAQVRSLHRPSTAATLNLAASAAQGARLFAPYDRAFSAKLLRAAKQAYAAAERVPDLYAPGADGAEGGGPYNDSTVTDEFYWAAAELYITTGGRWYLSGLRNSPHHKGNVFGDGGFDWGSVAALGRLDLATVKNALPEWDRQRVRRSVVAAGDRYITLQASQAYGQPYAPADNEYVWGSNSQILNNIVVLATAHDITGARRFRNAAIEGMDYILGRNALNQSYVTGYGEKHSRNMHSRWYSNQLDASLPNPPAGSVSGGPNSNEGTWDPTAQGLFGATGCAPQFCYVDDINSWSTNELTVNWNSALGWVASYVADQDNG